MLINRSSLGFQFLTSCSEVLARVKIKILMGRWEMGIGREGKMERKLQMELFLPAAHFQEDLERDKSTPSLTKITPNSRLGNGSTP